LAGTTAINLSADGARDWFAPAGNTGGNYHSKLLGGQMMKSFDWVNPLGTNLTTQSSSFAISSTTADDATGQGLVSLQTDQGVQTPGAATGFGLRFRVPAGNGFNRTLKVYCTTLSSSVTLTARLTDGSVVDATDLVDSPNGMTATHFVWTVNYQAARDGEELEISVIVTTNHGSSSNGIPIVKFAAATLQ
jgi:hypothetical protein